MPIEPVAQNRQAAAQPTWLDTHRLQRPDAMRRTTVSVSSPASVRSNSFVAPSTAESRR